MADRAHSHMTHAASRDK